MEKQILENLQAVRNKYSEITIEDIRAAITFENQTYSNSEFSSRDAETEMDLINKMIEQLDVFIEIFNPINSK